MRWDLLDWGICEFVRESALRRAEAILAEHERIVLSDRDRDRFLEALENPPKANRRLRESMKKYLRTRLK